MDTLIVIASVVCLAVLVFWAGNRMLFSERSGTALGDGLGNFIDVFDPGRSRSDQEIKSMENQTEVAPSPDDEHPVSVDLRNGTVHLRAARAARSLPEPPD